MTLRLTVETRTWQNHQRQLRDDLPGLVPVAKGNGYGFGLGFAVRTSVGGAAFPSSVGEYYWGGAGGTYMWVDPKLDMYVVFMLQSPKWRVHYRTVLRDMIYAAVLR